MIKRLVLLTLFIALVNCSTEDNGINTEAESPLRMLLCPFKQNSWNCVRTHTARVLDIFEVAVDEQKQKLFAEADRDAERMASARGLSSSSDENRKKKPSFVMQSIETGFEELTEFVSESLDEFVDPKKLGKADGLEIGANHHAGHNHFAPHAHEAESTHEVVDKNKIKGGHAHGGHGHTEGHGGHGGGHTGGHTGGHKISHGRKHGGYKFKSKKKLAILKILIIGSVLKAKLELLLKIIATKLQFKFLILATIALIINIARFWMEIKKGHQPQKVVYYEHAQHQHHYDEHDDKWWKRSLTVDRRADGQVRTKQQAMLDEKNQNPNQPQLYYDYDDDRAYRTNDDTYADGNLPQSDAQFDPQNLAYKNHKPYYA